MEIKIESEGHGATMPKDLYLGKKILDVLEKHYAGHAWFVDTNHESGHVTIQLMYEGPNAVIKIWKYGYLLHIPKLNSDNLEKKVVNAAGEVLERYHMQRGKATENDIIDFMTHGVDAGSMVV